MKEPVTLENCEREPIHIPGAIQPHGVLLACRPRTGLALTQLSANAEALFEQPLSALQAAALPDLFDEDSGAFLREAGQRSSLRELNPVQLKTRAGVALEGVLHRSGELLVLELERSRAVTRARGFDARLRNAILRLQAATSVETLTQVSAQEVREITGFDRVMVYRFDSDWNGQVVAEARRDDLEPFLGLHYPASDIPPQARKLYVQNWIRLIADVKYTASPLVPELDPETGAPLDLSHAHLRSVSPIHVEYLTNMGVSASMSISLVYDGELKGLIACHHYAGPHLVPYAVRETAEYLGQALSWNLRILEEAGRITRSQRVHSCEAEIAQSLATAEDVLDGLAVPAFVALTDATGAAIVLDEGVRCLGAAPDERRIGEIVEWLRANGHEIFATDRLASRFQRAESWDGLVAGLLAVAISRELGEYLLWFRPSVERVVDWAGDPRKQVVQTSAGAPRLSPRGSFALWRETVRGRAAPWEPWQVDAASNVRRLMVGGVRQRAVALRLLNARLVEADRAKDIFIATVSHELRTPLNAISGWAHLLEKGLAADKQGHAVTVVSRNADALARLVEDLIDVSRIVGGKLSLSVESVDIKAVVEGAIEAMALAAEAKSIRLKPVLECGTLLVLGDRERIRQVVTNLVSNAIKFTPKNGSVTISLQRDQSDVQIAVRDSGQGIDPADLPNVFRAFWQADASTRRKSAGLGLGLAIAKKLVELHGGRITAESDGVDRGSTFVVRIPIASAKAAEEDRASRAPDKRASETLLADFTILVLEDEDDSRSLLVHIIESEGARVVAVPNAALALERLAQESIDAIVSDVGLPDMDGLEFMRAVRASGKKMPAVALTAYTRAYDRTAALRAGFQAHVPKPADPDELIAVLASLLGRVSSPD
ncbi:MAG TPA: ATP-binding protein [Polyangiales bacterium]